MGKSPTAYFPPVTGTTERLKEVRRNILLNPGPGTTTDTVKNALLVPDICPREEEFGTLLRNVRKKLVALVNGEETHTAVLFASSGTGAVEACISSVIGPQDKILIHVNGSYGQRMVEMARVFYRPDQVVVWEDPFGTFPAVEQLDERLKQDPGITFAGFVHHETTTGMLNPAPQFLEVAKRRGVKCILDAMSSYAGIVIDLRQTPYDFVISSANKCIQAMAGVSFVICNHVALKESAGNPPKNFYFNLWEQHRAFEQTSQLRFTPPVQVFYALDQALDELAEETVEGRYRRYAQCWEVLVQGLENAGMELLLPRQYHSKLLTAVKEPRADWFDFQEMHDVLYKKGMTVYPGKISGNSTFRIANIGALTPQDIHFFLEEFMEYIRRKKHAVDPTPV